jgi:hypothetical protein
MTLSHSISLLDLTAARYPALPLCCAINRMRREIYPVTEYSIKAFVIGDRVVLEIGF